MNLDDLNRDGLTLHQKRVLKFIQNLQGFQCPNKPTVKVPADVLQLCANLINEEAWEAIKGLGFDTEEMEVGEALVQIDEPNLVEIVDGCCDTIYVCLYTLCRLGVIAAPIQELVDLNNLEKTWSVEQLKALTEAAEISSADNGNYIVRRMSDKKLLKPPGHPKPRILQALIAQGYDPNETSAK